MNTTKTPSTKKRMKRVVIFNANEALFELLTLAAQHRDVSRSEFLRLALRKEASRVLAGARVGA